MDERAQLGGLLFPIAGIPDVGAFLRNRGTDFAVGGSTSLYLIATYLANNGGRADPTNLYVIWIGADDFQAGLTPKQTSAAIEPEVVALYVLIEAHVPEELIETLRGEDLPDDWNALLESTPPAKWERNGQWKNEARFSEFLALSFRAS